MQKTKIYLLSMFCVLVIAGCINTISQSMYKDLVNNKNHYPSAEMCGDCHVAIYEEWKTSKHALAYTSKTFQEQSNDYEFKECLPCHAPETIFNDKIKLREYRREEGVTCAVCHLVDGQFAGPLEHSAIVLPHPITIRTSLYRSSEICGKCHEGSYKEWLTIKKEDKKNCQECHMTEVIRKVTQGTDFISNQLVKFEHEGKLRKHQFHLGNVEDIEDAIHIDISNITQEDDFSKIHISIQNNVPHSIPSGSFGFRKALLTIRFFEEQNQEVYTFSREFFKELDTPLKASSTWEQELKIPIKAYFAEISLERITKEERQFLYRRRLQIQ